MIDQTRVGGHEGAVVFGRSTGTIWSGVGDGAFPRRLLLLLLGWQNLVFAILSSQKRYS